MENKIYTDWGTKELQEKIREFMVKASEKFDIPESAIINVPPVKINGRLSRALGRCMGRMHRGTGKIETVRIEFQKNFIKNYDDEIVMDVIGHETAHHICNILYKGNQGHNSKFKEVAKYLGVGAGTSVNISNHIRVESSSTPIETEKKLRNPFTVDFKYILCSVDNNKNLLEAINVFYRLSDAKKKHEIRIGEIKNNNNKNIILVDIKTNTVYCLDRLLKPSLVATKDKESTQKILNAFKTKYNYE